MAYKFPDFLVIGAARCGSTWIHEALKEHSAVCVPNRKKELHFFNRESNFKLGTEYYAAFFNEKSDNQICGEVTPTYLCDEKSAARIANILPDAKLIVCLRNPTDRAFSAYQGHVMAGRISENTSIFRADEILVFDNQSSLLEHGQYAKHLERFFRLFPRENIHITFYEDFRKNPRVFIGEIYSFIGVKRDFIPSIINKKVNEGRYSSMLRIINVLANYAPLILRGRINNIVIFLRKRFAPVHKAIPPKIKTELDEYYKTHNTILMDLLNKPLPENWPIDKS